MKTVGHATPRIDAVERVTGRAKYTNDVQLPGMLYAKVLRSPHPHARIRSIDVSKAKRDSPGVKAILTHENCQVVWGAGSVAGGQQYSDEVKKNTKQRRYAFNNPVRFVGEPVAAVAAVNRHVAEEALHADRGRLRSAAVRHRSGRRAQARRAEDLARGQPRA